LTLLTSPTILCSRSITLRTVYSFTTTVVWTFPYRPFDFIDHVTATFLHYRPHRWRFYTFTGTRCRSGISTYRSPTVDRSYTITRFSFTFSFVPTRDLFTYLHSFVHLSVHYCWFPITVSFVYDVLRCSVCRTFLPLLIPGCLLPYHVSAVPLPTVLFRSFYVIHDTFCVPLFVEFISFCSDCCPSVILPFHRCTFSLPPLLLFRHTDILQFSPCDLRYVVGYYTFSVDYHNVHVPVVVIWTFLPNFLSYIHLFYDSTTYRPLITLPEQIRFLGISIRSFVSPFCSGMIRCCFVLQILCLRFVLPFCRYADSTCLEFHSLNDLPPASTFTLQVLLPFYHLSFRCYQNHLHDTLLPLILSFSFHWVVVTDSGISRWPFYSIFDALLDLTTVYRFPHDYVYPAILPLVHVYRQFVFTVSAVVFIHYHSTYDFFTHVILPLFYYHLPSSSVHRTIRYTTFVRYRLFVDSFVVCWLRWFTVLYVRYYYIVHSLFRWFLIH